MNTNNLDSIKSLLLTCNSSRNGLLQKTLYRDGDALRVGYRLFHSRQSCIEGLRLLESKVTQIYLDKINEISHQEATLTSQSIESLCNELTPIKNNIETYTHLANFNLYNFKGLFYYIAKKIFQLNTSEYQEYYRLQKKISESVDAIFFCKYQQMGAIGVETNSSVLKDILSNKSTLPNDFANKIVMIAYKILQNKAPSRNVFEQDPRYNVYYYSKYRAAFIDNVEEEWLFPTTERDYAYANYIHNLKPSLASGIEGFKQFSALYGLKEAVVSKSDSLSNNTNALLITLLDRKIGEFIGEVKERIELLIPDQNWIHLSEILNEMYNICPQSINSLTPLESLKNIELDQNLNIQEKVCLAYILGHTINSSPNNIPIDFTLRNHEFVNSLLRDLEQSSQNDKREEFTPLTQCLTNEILDDPFKALGIDLSTEIAPDIAIFKWNNSIPKDIPDIKLLLKNGKEIWVHSPMILRTDEGLLESLKYSWKGNEKVIDLTHFDPVIVVQHLLYLYDKKTLFKTPNPLYKKWSEFSYYFSRIPSPTLFKISGHIPLEGFEGVAAPDLQIKCKDGKVINSHKIHIQDLIDISDLSAWENVSAEEAKILIDFVVTRNFDLEQGPLLLETARKLDQKVFINFYRDFFKKWVGSSDNSQIPALIKFMNTSVTDQDLMKKISSRIHRDLESVIWDAYEIYTLGQAFQKANKPQLLGDQKHILQAWLLADFEQKGELQYIVPIMETYGIEEYRDGYRPDEPARTKQHVLDKIARTRRSK